MSGSLRRPRAVWAAFATAVAAIVLVVVGVLLPILGLIGAADGATAGALRVPVGQIAVAILVGYGLAALLVLLCARSRRSAIAWALAVSAVVSTLLVSLWPLVATALSGATQTQELLPAIREIIGLVGG